MWWHRTLHDSWVELRMIAMLRKFLLFFVRILRQIFCCFGRKRTESNSHDDRLETINVIKSDSGREYNRNGTVSFMRQNWVELFNFHPFTSSYTHYTGGRARLELMGWLAAHRQRTHPSVQGKLSQTCRARAGERGRAVGSLRRAAAADSKTAKVLPQSRRR